MNRTGLIVAGIAALGVGLYYWKRKAAGAVVDSPAGLLTNDAAGPRLPSLPKLPKLTMPDVSGAVPNMPGMPSMPRMPKMGELTW